MFRKIKFKVLYFITLWEITCGNNTRFYKWATFTEKKRIAKNIVNEYLKFK